MLTINIFIRGSLSIILHSLPIAFYIHLLHMYGLLKGLNSMKSQSEMALFYQQLLFNQNNVEYHRMFFSSRESNREEFERG